MNRIYSNIFIGLLVAFTCLPGLEFNRVEAATVNWQGGGEGDRDGVYGVAANWSPVQVPNADDQVVFSRDEAYTVTFDAPVTNQNAYVYEGTVTFNLGGHEWAIEWPGNTPRFDIRGNADGLIRPVAIVTNGILRSASELRIAPFTGNRYGTLVVRGGNTILNANNIYMGASGGQAVLRMEAGATGTVGANFRFHGSEDNTSQLFVEGTGTFLESGNIEADGPGGGAITISDGGELSVNDFSITRGSILLDGGTLKVRRDMWLGVTGSPEGDLTLTLRNNAVLTCVRHGRLGRTGSNVTGRIESGSQWIAGTGGAYIGDSPGAGELTVTSTDSLLQALAVGVNVANSTGSGSLTVADGGRVEFAGTYSLRIAAVETTAIGSVIITGSNSVMTGINRIDMAGNHFAPGHGSHIKGGQALLALRDGGWLETDDSDPANWLDLRVQETGTVELDGGSADLRKMVFYPPDGVIAANAGTLRVILHPNQANTGTAMVTTTDNNELNGARFELALATGFKPQLGDEFKIIAGAMTNPVGTFTWQGEDITDGDILMVGNYGFRADIEGNNFTLTTAVAPPAGTIFSVR